MILFDAIIDILVVRPLHVSPRPRVELALAVRRLREVRQLSQKQLGRILKTSQPRVAKIEHAAADVSIDQQLRAFTAAGGRIVISTKKTRKGRKSLAHSETFVFVGTSPE
jgi:transcriptional regulator with XRE-family HTH domain